MSVVRRVTAVLGGLLLAFAVWGMYVGWLAVQEGATPPAAALPAAPVGVDSTPAAKACGSGGCWQELRLTPAPGTAPDQVVAALGLGGERCDRDGWPDPRATCVGATVLADGVVLVHAVYRW